MPDAVKVWWRLVGSAVEYAADRHITCAVTSPACPPQKIAFKDLFLRQEEEDAESTSLTDVLGALAEKWPNTARFTAGNVATMVNDRSEYSATPKQNQTLREFLFPDAHPSLIATPVAVGKRLHRHAGEPVARDGQTFILKSARPGGKHALEYFGGGDRRHLTGGLGVGGTFTPWRGWEM